MTQYCSIEKKTAALHTDFARDFVARRFGGKDAADQIYSLLPIYTRGKNKGLVKGFIHWHKVNVGGWSREHGRVMVPGVADVSISLAYEALRDGEFFERSHHASELPETGEYSWSAYIERGVASIIDRDKNSKRRWG